MTSWKQIIFSAAKNFKPLIKTSPFICQPTILWNTEITHSVQFIESMTTKIKETSSWKILWAREENYIKQTDSNRIDKKIF